MTIGFLQTARLNATPLSRHIDTPEQPKPQFASIDDYADAMLAESKAIRRRAAGQSIREQVEISTDDILALVEHCPGLTSDDIAEKMGRSISVMRTRMTKLQKQGRVKIGYVQRGTVKARVFYINPEAHAPRPVRKGSPRRDMAVAFIRANQGCTANDLGDHMGLSVRAASAFISEIRKILPVRTVRVPGAPNNTPARYFIEEDAE